MPRRQNNEPAKRLCVCAHVPDARSRPRPDSRGSETARKPERYVTEDRGARWKRPFAAPPPPRDIASKTVWRILNSNRNSEDGRPARLLCRTPAAPLHSYSEPDKRNPAHYAPPHSSGKSASQDRKSV